MGLTEHSPFWQRIGLVRPPLWHCWHMALVLHRRSSSRRCSPSSSRCTASRRPSCSQRCGSIAPQIVVPDHSLLCSILQVPALPCASAVKHVMLVLHRRASNHRCPLNRSRCTASRRPSCSQRRGSVVPQIVFSDRPLLCSPSCRYLPIHAHVQKRICCWYTGTRSISAVPI